MTAIETCILATYGARTKCLPAHNFAKCGSKKDVDVALAGLIQSGHLEQGEMFGHFCLTAMGAKAAAAGE